MVWSYVGSYSIPLRTSNSGIVGLATDGTYLYWIDQDISSGVWYINRCDLETGANVSNYQLLLDGNASFRAEGMYYYNGYLWALFLDMTGYDTNKLYRFEWNGSVSLSSSIDRDYTDWDGIAYNPNNNKTYGIDSGEDRLCYFNGQSVLGNDVTITTVSQCDGIAYSNETGYLYISRYNSINSLQVYDISGNLIENHDPGYGCDDLTAYGAYLYMGYGTTIRKYQIATVIPEPTSHWYVRPGGSGVKNGYDWDNAMDTQHQAMDEVVAGGTVHVAFGTYNNEPANNKLSPDASDVTIKYEAADTGGGSGTSTVEINR